jgi:penicillin-insensitive murein DD-endopeptidase
MGTSEPAVAKRRHIFVRASLVAALTVASHSVGTAQRAGEKPLFDRWANAREPLPGPPAPIGFYSAGCLQGAEALPLDGTGYAVMHPSRHRFYGHPALVSYLTELAKRTHAENGRLLLIGDLGLPRGGPMLTGHDSHQNGLDADVWLTTRANVPTATERETLSAQSFVIGRKKLKPTFGPAQATLLAAAADNSAINRIFVSPAIKRYMCRNFSTASWLYRLRSWWGHDDHFHVRLKCPGGDPQCREQDALDPANNGCGAELDWWFSKEADREWARLSASTEPRRFPELPAACTAIAQP